MRLKISLFNKCIIKSDLKRFWWTGALYAVLLFFSLPLYHMLQVLPLKEDWQKEALLGSLRLSSNTSPVSINVQVLLICTLPIFLAVMLFSYLHSAQAATMLHSLPLNRITLLGSHAASGMLLISAPVLVTAGFLAALASFTGLGEYYSIIDVAAWTGLTLLFNMLFFSIAVFVGMFTGNAIAHIVFTYIFNVLPYGLYMLVAYSLERLLYGFSADSLNSGWAQALPLVKVTGFIFSRFTFVQGLIYLLTVFIFFIAAGLAYNARKLETAGNIVAFRAVRPVFKYGVAACLMLSGGYIAGYINNSGRTAVIAAYFIFAAVGYWMSQMLLEKTVRVWHAYKGFLLLNVAVTLLLVGISADVTGYVKRIPALDDIESAYFGNFYSTWLHKKDNPSQTASISMEGFFREEANIKTVTNLHSVLANGGSKADELDGSTAYMAEGGNIVDGRDEYIAYTLKDGRSVVRKYTIDENAVRGLLKPLYESLEYKEEKYPVLGQNTQDIKWMEIGDRRTAKKPLVLSDEKRIQSFVDIMKKELIDADYEEVTEPENGYAAYIQITDRNGVRSDYSLRRSFNTIFSWLEDNGYYKSVMLLPEDIDHVSVQALKTTWYKNGGVSYSDVGNGKNLSGSDIIKELIDICSPGLSRGSGTCFRLEFYSRAVAVQPDFKGFISSGTPMSATLRQKLGEMEENPGTAG